MQQIVNYTISTANNRDVAEMILKTDRDTAKERIIKLTAEGNSLLEKITAEYFDLRRVGAFIQDKHIPAWSSKYSDWFRKCLTTLNEIFPTQREALKLKNAPASPFMQDGTNLKWGSLVNTIKAKLFALDEIIDAVDSYIDEQKQKDADAIVMSDNQVKPRWNKSRTMAVALFIPGIVIALITNIATTTLPNEFKPYL